jgi:hypothetical protein
MLLSWLLLPCAKLIIRNRVVGAFSGIGIDVERCYAVYYGEFNLVLGMSHKVVRNHVAATVAAIFSCGRTADHGI